jgi:hypothetical protein
MPIINHGLENKHMILDAAVQILVPEVARMRCRRYPLYHPKLPSESIRIIVHEVVITE